MNGGIFKVLDLRRTENPRDPDADKYYDILLWGIVSKKPRLSARAKDGVARIQFGVRYRKGTFVNFIVLADNPHTFTVASRLKVGDPVAIVGKLREYHYFRKNKKTQEPEPRVGSDANAHMIFPMRMIAGWMEQLDDGKTPDAIEGLEEYLQSTEKEEIPW